MIRFLLLALIACMAFGSLSTLGAEEAAKAGEVKRCTAAEWCFEEDMPKAKCVHCDKKVIVQLKKDGDWCKEDQCAESLCMKCDAKAATAKLDAMRPESKDWPKDWKPKHTAVK